MDAKAFCDLWPGGVDFRLTRYAHSGDQQWYASLHKHPEKGPGYTPSVTVTGATAEEALAQLRARVAPSAPPTPTSDIDDLI